MTGVEAATELAVLMDVGSAWAKAGVIGRVGGQWRLVAHATQPTAWGPAELRRSLVTQLEAAGDRRLAGSWDGLVSGANRIECHTARRQGRLAVIAVSREISGSAARRAAESAGWEVGPSVTLDDGRSLAERLAVLQTAEVDAWLAVGGFDDGTSPRALEAAALVAAARLPGSAPVTWAGSARLAEEVSGMFEEGAVTVVANARPDARGEASDPLREHLRELLRRLLGGEDETHITAVSLPRAIGALAADGRLGVLAVDIGARTAIRVLAEPDGSTSVRVNAGGGLSGAVALPGAAGRVVRLASDAGDEATVADLLQTLRARPVTLPEHPEELAAIQAATRLQLAALVEDAGTRPLDLVIGCGRTIAAAPRPAQAARMLLDGVRPIGVTQLAIDPASLLAPLGSLPDTDLREGLRLLSDDLIVPLGTAVVTRGGEPGQVAMRVTVHRPGWPTGAPIVMRHGALQVVPLGRGQEAELTIEPGPGVSLGTGRRSPRIQAMATGGAVGLILDTRGVPTSLPRRADDRRAVIASWADAFMRETERGS